MRKLSKLHKRPVPARGWQTDAADGDADHREAAKQPDGTARSEIA